MHIPENKKWSLSKSALEKMVVAQAETIVEQLKSAKPGEILSKQELMDGVACQLSRGKYDESLMINIFLDGEEHDSAQVELRRAGPDEWNIADRQVNRAEHKGKGILKAFVRAAEKFVERFAALEGKEATTHKVFLGTAQPNVFQVFEHLGYAVHKGDEDNAKFLRDPSRFPDDVVVQNAWMKARTSEERLELQNRDPYCFFKETIKNDPRPLPKDAIRVTLEKFIRPAKNSSEDLIKRVRNEAQELL